MRNYTYRKLKAQARQEAIDLQNRMSEESLSWGGFAYITSVTGLPRSSAKTD